MPSHAFYIYIIIDSVSSIESLYNTECELFEIETWKKNFMEFNGIFRLSFCVWSWNYTMEKHQIQSWSHRHCCQSKRSLQRSLRKCIRKIINCLAIFADFCWNLLISVFNCCFIISMPINLLRKVMNVNCQLNWIARNVLP